MKTDRLYAGVELGGTKCVALIARGPDDIVAGETVPTTTPDETLGRLKRTLRAWGDRHDVEALGIASFGPLDLDPSSPGWGTIVTTSKAGWTDTDVAGRLGRALGKPVAFDTDVNGAALAEMRWGAGQGIRDFAYITVGTGVGVGLIVNGRPTRGFGHCEMGHVRVEQRDDERWVGACAFHGACVEGLASGPAIGARAAPRAVTSLQSDDPLWDSVAWALAQLCHTIVLTAAPLRIAMGGGVVSGQPHLLPRINRMLVESLNGYVILPSDGDYVRAPMLGDDAGPLGAIALAMSARP